MDATLDQPIATQDLIGIDKEHQVQIGLLDAFCKLVEKDGLPEKINEIFDQLRSFSDAHFMSEQLLMRMYAYPEYNDHVHDHEAMTEHLSQIKQQFSSGKNNTALESATKLRKFILAHINSRDQAFTSYLTSLEPAH